MELTKRDHACVLRAVAPGPAPVRIVPPGESIEV